MSFTISSLSEDPISNIFSFLDAQALRRCCQVDKKWSKIANDDDLWRGLFPDVVVPSGMSLKKYLEVVALSEDKILQKIKDFCSRVSVNQTGKFECLFPFNPKCKINIELAYSKVKGEAPLLKEAYMVGKKVPYKPGFVPSNPEAVEIYTLAFGPTLSNRPGFGRFQSRKISIVYGMVLPAATSLDCNFVGEVRSSLGNRIKELEVEATRSDLGYIFGNAAKIAVLVAIALNTCFPLTY